MTPHAFYEVRLWAAYEHETLLTYIAFSELQAELGELQAELGELQAELGENCSWWCPWWVETDLTLGCGWNPPPREGRAQQEQLAYLQGCEP